MEPPTLRTYLERAAFPRRALERFLDPAAETWAKFDPELGFQPSDVIVKDGQDGSRTIGTYEPTGVRRMIHYRQRPCRLNTYGDSFTQCAQVNDGETWQEGLAAHFGEPVRNCGVGSYGVYQAYRRMNRIESTADGAPYVILNVYEVDHCRNLMASVWLHIPWFHPMAQDGTQFHGTPWAHVRLDPATGAWREIENPFATPAALYRLCDPAFVYETYRHDPVVKLELLRQGGQLEDTKDLQALAEFFGVRLDLSTPETARQTGAELWAVYALRSTMFVVERARQFCQARGKKLMILLSYGGTVPAVLQGKPRFDQALVEYLAGTGLPVVDTLAAHVEDYRAFRLSPEEYVKRYYIGHYNPAGNQFFAFAIKNALVRWLDPKPPTYSADPPPAAAFVEKPD